MIVSRNSATTIVIPARVQYIARGAVAGFLFGILFNYNRWNCFFPGPTLEELYKTQEPDIPEEYVENLTKPNPIYNAEITLTPWKILQDDGEYRYYMTFLVYTAISDAKKRFHARLSWASVAEIEGKRISVIFVTAGSPSGKKKKLIIEENNLYGDILLIDTHATVEIETIKIISAFRWCIENLKNRMDYVVNLNCGMFPSLPSLYRYIKKIEEDLNARNLLHCGARLAGPERKETDVLAINYVKVNTYRNEFYPSYCTADIVVFSYSMMKMLHDTASFTTEGPIPRGEVYVYGILREKLRGEGEKNIIDAMEYFNTLKLGYYISFERGNAAVLIQRHWDATKSLLMFDESEETSSEQLRAKLLTIPISDPKETPESDMKSMLSKW